MAKGDYGFNATIACPGLGRRRVRVTRMRRKVSVITNEDEGKTRRAIYPQIVTSSGFEMDIVFVSYAERGRFNRWITNYMEQVVDGTAKVGVLTVTIPHLDYSQVCVPESEITYGEGLTDLGYTLTMGFVGASDALGLDLPARQAGLSYFKAAERGRTTSRHFYPAARQVSGAEDLDGTIFDQPDKSASYPYAPGAVTPVTDEGPDPVGGRPW